MEEATHQLLVSNGPWGAAVVILITAVIALFLAYRQSVSQRQEDHQACSETAEKSYEARLKESASSTTALNQNTAALTTLISSTQAQTELLNELAKGQTILFEQVRAYHALTKDQGDRIEKRQEQILAKLDDVLRSPQQRRGS